jgi:AcrR family transcriptional regulator
MRADARKNYSRLLEVARDVFSERGADTSLRDIARRAEVGFATLLRHFPSREALVEAMFCDDLNALTQEAADLETAQAPDEALTSWFHKWIAFTQSHKGVVTLMAAAHTNPESAMYASCASVHAASARLLVRAQAEGTARADMTGNDFFGLLVDLPPFAPRADYLSNIVASAILTNAAPPAA